MCLTWKLEKAMWKDDGQRSQACAESEMVSLYWTSGDLGSSVTG